MFKVVLSVVAGMAATASSLAQVYHPALVFTGCSILTFCLLVLLQRVLWPSHPKAKASLSTGVPRKSRKKSGKRKKRKIKVKVDADDDFDHDDVWDD